MNPQHHKTGQTNDRRPLENLAVVVVASTPAVRDAIGRALADCEPAIDLVDAEHVTDVAALDPAGPIAALCLECDAGPEAARATMRQAQDAARQACVLLFDGGDAGLDRDTAIAEGAIDLIAPGAQAVLAARLRQALALVRTRLALQQARDRLQALQKHATQNSRMALHRALARLDDRLDDRADDSVRGLVFVAVDEIAALRERVGPATSDRLLQEVGAFLLGSLHDDDRVFRLGSDEYVLLLTRHTAAALAESARQLGVAIARETFADDAHSACLTASIAYCALGEASQADARLGALIDAAHRLRADGGNRCEASESPAAAVGDDLAEDDERVDGAQAAAVESHADGRQWFERLRSALAQNRFSLAYQSISGLAGDSQPYFDVLLRYVEEDGTLVPAGEFLPAAEDAQLMSEIDGWVTQRAVEIIHRRQRDPIGQIALFVKISAATLANDEAALGWLKDALQAHPIDAGNIVFSVRTDDVLDERTKTFRLARQIDALGFRVALTQFGTSPGAAQLLDAMPTSFIKIAPEVAQVIVDGADDDAVTRLIAGAGERQIPLIAERIEDAESMARLWQAGVNYVQGHFIQEPNTDALNDGAASRE